MPKKIFLSIFSLIALTLLCHCQMRQANKWTSDNLIIDDHASLEFPEVISAKQVDEDIDFLTYALQNGYGGRKYVPAISFSNALSSLQKISGKLSVKDFHDSVDEALYEIPDNHMAAFYRGTVSRKRLEHEKAGQVGKNNISSIEKVWEARIDKLGKKKILYISIAAFPDGDSDVWKGFIPSVSKQIKSVDFIVMDLRGNGGGDDSKGMELAKVLFGHEIEHPIKRQIRSQTAETFALNVSRIKIRIINMKKQDSKVPESLVNELSRAQSEYQEILNGKISAEFVRTDKGIGSRYTPVTGFKKPIYILIDSACSSSCEFTVAAFEWHSSAKRVGENTNGTFHYSNAGMLVLPNSKIKVKIPTQYNEYYDLRFIERIGFSPDIVVPPGEDAYEVVKRSLL